MRSTPEVVPRVVVWRCRGAANKIECHVGLVRSPDDSAHTTLHACTRAPPSCQPAPGRGAIAWNLASRTTTPSTEERRLLPGIAAGRAPRAPRRRPNRTEQAPAQPRREHGPKQHRSRVQRRAAPPSGARALVCGRAGARRRRALHSRAGRIGAQLAYARASISDGEPLPETTESCALLADAPLDAQPEPYCTPANTLALCLHVNEVVRVLMKSRRGEATPGHLRRRLRARRAAPDGDKPQTLGGRRQGFGARLDVTEDLERNRASRCASGATRTCGTWR